MVIHWFSLSIGIILLWLPTIRIFHRSAKLRTYPQLIEQSVRKRSRPWWWLPAWWISPLQGFLGAFLVRGAFEIQPDAAGLIRQLPLLLVAAILALSVLIEMLFFSDDMRVISPFGLVAGVSFALLPYSVAIPALILATTSVPAIKTVPSYFLAGAACTAGVGYLMMGRNLWMMLATGIYLMPVVIAFMQGRFLSLPSRN